MIELNFRLLRSRENRKVAMTIKTRDNTVLVLIFTWWKVKK
jgi:hypothetical protein